MRKVLLINPDFRYFPGFPGGGLVDYKKAPLGLLYLAGYIRKYSACDVRICDAYMLGLSEKAVGECIADYQPDIVGIHVTTPAVASARSVARLCRRIQPSCRIIFGGPHPTVLPFENLDICDACVIGEGEQTFAEIISENPADWDKIKGIALLKDGMPYKTPEREQFEDLDILSFPARDLLPYNGRPHIYPYKLDTTVCNTIVTSRGCGFNCGFCLSSRIWRNRVRYRSMDNIFAEVDELVKVYKTSLLHIHDDNFTGSRERVMEFCEIKQRRYPRLKWICYVFEPKNDSTVGSNGNPVEVR
jgi:radical SAM superfamily enzyme YgiQ (UPF0313 family)